MPKLIIKNHRGLTNLNYCDLNESKKKIFRNIPDLLILDETIKKLFPDIVNEFLFIKEVIILKAGESSKTLKGVFNLLQKIDKLNIYPINHVLLISGASLQDNVATALSLLKRGTKWSYIPSTLLAQADSCIGSKTSLNSDNSKNLYGVFYAPTNIYILPSLLKKLPDTEVISGIGDAMHYLLLDVKKNLNFIENLINYLLEENPNKFINNEKKVKELCFKCHEIKKYFIEIDEFDKKERNVLNLGHSFGHALESFLNYEIPHGVGVLFGLIFAIDISNNLQKNQLTNKFREDLSKIRLLIYKLINKYSPLKPEYIFKLLKDNPNKYLRILAKDKKNTSKGKYKVIVFIEDKPFLYECEQSVVVNYITKL